LGYRRVDDKSTVGKGRSEGSSFRVTVFRRDVGVGEDIINIYIGVKGGRVERVKN
jgi:hypothetical protein